MERIEAQIVNRLLDTIYDAHYQVSVDDGENETPPISARHRVRKDMDSTSRDMVYLWKRDDKGEMQRQGWILLVYGNGVDILTDYSTNLESLLKPVNDWIYSELDKRGK